jgi:hypothetical protein
LNRSAIIVVRSETLLRLTRRTNVANRAQRIERVKVLIRGKELGIVGSRKCSRHNIRGVGVLLLSSGVYRHYAHEDQQQERFGIHLVNQTCENKNNSKY